jgi:hypothetical protein
MLVRAPGRRDRFLFHAFALVVAGVLATAILYAYVAYCAQGHPF